MKTSLRDTIRYALTLPESPEKERILYHLEQAIPHKAKIDKAIVKGHKDIAYCGNCHYELPEAYFKYCPVCGCRIKDGWHIGYCTKTNKEEKND